MMPTHTPATGLAADIERLVRPQVQALAAYHVAPAEGLVKLDAMENPYHWPQPLVDAWLERLRAVQLNRYPAADPLPLKRQLAIGAGVPPGAELLLGNGSDELIQLVAMSVARPGASALVLQPSFSMYRLIGEACGLTVHGCELDANFEIDPPRLFEALERYQPALVLVDYPNNPSGRLFDREVLLELMRRAPGLVVIDEAYFPFAERSFMPALAQFPNLLVMRTLSKVGLAGLRLGFLAGHPAWLEQFNKIRLPYNVNSLTQASAEFALAAGGLFVDQAACLRRDRAELEQALAQLDGVQYWPSATNFILFRVTGTDAAGVYEALLGQGILIKSLAAQGGLLQNCLRVTVGTPEENRLFLAALRRALAA